MDAQGTTVSIDTLLNKINGKNIYVVSSIVRNYPLLAYMGMYIPNKYKQAILDNTLKPEEAKTINYKELANIKPTMSEDGSKVTWYEAESFANSQTIAADTAGGSETEVELADVKGFAVGDVVLTVPAAGSAGTRTQAKIASINTGTKVITLSANADVRTGDSLVFLYPSFEFNTKVSRTVADDDATPITTYFQKFGGSVDYTIQETNKVFLLEDAKDRVTRKFAGTTNQAINNIATTFYTGRNISGANAETDGLERVIAEKVANGENVDLTITGANDKAKIVAIQNMLRQAASAPVYLGNEQPTGVVNENMIADLTALLQSDITYNNFIEKEIDWGLKAFSSPFYKNIMFLVDKTLDVIYPVTSVGFLLPKHLVTFMTPMYDIPDAAGVQKTYSANGFKVIKQPQTTGDSIEFTLELWLANIFGGQSYENSYIKFTM